MKYIAPFGKVYAKKSDKRPLSREIELKEGESIRDYMLMPEPKRETSIESKSSGELGMTASPENEYTRKGKKYE